MKSALRYMMSVLLTIWATTGLMADDDFNPDNPPEPMAQYVVSISADPAEATSSITLGGSFAIGKVLQISVKAASDYVFQYWTLNGVQYSTKTSFSYTVGDSAANFVAVLKIKPLISVSVTPQGAGSAYGGGRYTVGSSKKIYTNGNNGYTFLYWTLNGVQYTDKKSFYYSVGDSTANFVAVYKDDNIEPPVDPDAPFTPDDPAEPEVYYRLDVQTNLPDNVSPRAISPSEYYAPGKNITLFTTAPDGYIFQYWALNDILYADQPSCPYVTGDSNVVFTAYFATLHSITLNVNPASAGTVSGTGKYEPNTKVLITATPNEGYTFLHWTRNGEIYAQTTSFYFIINNADATFEAVFEKIPEQPQVIDDPEQPFIPSNPPEPETNKTALLITVGVNDTTLGAVTGLPTTPLFAGDLITLEAVSSNPQEFYFLHWTDGNTANPRNITLTVDARYVAVFARQQYLITFYDEDSITVIDQREWGYGETPTCISPAKASDEEHSYRFGGWQPDIVPVTRDTAYYATYEELPLDVPQDVNNTEFNAILIRKLFRNGNIYILRGEKVYTITGQEVK